MFPKLLLFYCGLGIFLFSCSDPKIKKINLSFAVDLSSYARVTDMEIGGNYIFLLTDKHEILTYDQQGMYVYDTLFASPRLYPNGAVEVYLNNSFSSVFYFDEKLFFQGLNPPDIYEFDLENQTFNKNLVTLSDRGIHQVMSTNFDELFVGFRNPQKGIFQVFKIHFPSFEVILLDEFTQTKSKNKFVTYSFQDDIFLLNTLEKGLFKYGQSDFSKVSEDFFLDSILYKGELKNIFDLGEYSSLVPWQRNQYRSDQILSAIQISESETFFLLKLLNRTDPNLPDFEIVLYKNSGDKVFSKSLEGFQFAKLDTETQTFLGFTFENKALVISNLDSLLNN
jgi:hypothetical protein